MASKRSPIVPATDFTIPQSFALQPALYYYYKNGEQSVSTIRHTATFYGITMNCFGLSRYTSRDLSSSYFSETGNPPFVHHCSLGYC